MIETDWIGCYSESWKGLIVDEAFAHPAKVSFGLAARIYQHLFELQWAQPGMNVVDPFGGICGFGFHAAIMGLHFVGCELEAKFVLLGNENIELWKHRYGHRQGYGSARLVQGDSRRLGEVLGGAGLCVGSPPFAEIVPQQDKSFIAPHDSSGNLRGDYGHSPGQLGAMPDRGFDLVMSSPPFAEQQRGGGLALECDGKKIGKNCGYQSQGDSDGQLSAMPDRGFQMACGSPPFESVEGSHSAKKFKNPEQSAVERSEGYRSGRLKGHFASKEAEQSYGDTIGNLGNSTGNTFWLAARQILEQTYAVLAPGAHACWVVKGFIRKGRYVDFPDQWRQLCESVGFTTLHWHRCWLVEHAGTQQRLLGPEKPVTTERKSFFRKNGEIKAQAKEHWGTLPANEQQRFLTQARSILAGPKPTERRVLEAAQVAAYRFDEMPPLDIATRIDYEIVICCVK